MSKHPNGETPLMKQYNTIKAKYPGAIILFRIGDFYETFSDDAVKASQALNITLTKRANGSASEIELAGFPYHALDNYLPKLVRAGYRVAICEQLEDPKMAKGIVKRGVTEIITPGVTFNDKILDHQQNNYLATLTFQKNNIVGSAFVDVSTGDFFYYTSDIHHAEKLLYRLRPSEVVLARKDIATFKGYFNDDFYTYRLEDWVFEVDYGIEKINQHFKSSSIKGFGLEESPAATIACGVLLHYLRENEHKNLDHINRLYQFDDDQYVSLDRFTIKNLELIHPLHADGISLFQTINFCYTSMGARMLKKWMLFPLRNVDAINQRSAGIAAILDNESFLTTVGTLLQQIGDPERLIARLATQRINPRECVALRTALAAFDKIYYFLAQQMPDFFGDILTQVVGYEPVLKLLNQQLNDECPANLNNGGVFRTGVNTDLDNIRTMKADSEGFLEAVRQREIKRTGITSLKISFNKVFGYYIEISNANKNLVPDDYIRKQTLTNGERFITPELKEFEEQILSAEERILNLENHLYAQLLIDLQVFIPILQVNAQQIAFLDVLQGLARLALKRNYTRPLISTDDKLLIVEGRHPVIEVLLPSDNPYIPNDVYLDNTESQIMVITGPNMAGKSATLRQTALITLMAQMGSYVPAAEARIGLVDKIFTRVGASDNLSSGESTFMVEMNETARILHHTTSQSLILLDEIGRGTSTYDGVAIAWALVEYLHNTPNQNPKTMFATHYHELAQLAEQLPRVKNFTISVKEISGKILFLRKLIEGSNERSFGIHVAEMAGMPSTLVDRAKELLQYLESEKAFSINQTPSSKIKAKKKQDAAIYQTRLFNPEDLIGDALCNILDDLDVNTLTPVDAIIKIVEMKQTLEKMRSSK